jgi:lactate permease
MWRSSPSILATGAVMAFLVWLAAWLGAGQLASAVAGLVGCGVLWLLVRPRSSEEGQRLARLAGSARSGGDPAPSPGSGRLLSPHLAFLPYYLLILLTVVGQLPPVKEAASALAWGLDYPAAETALGHQVAAARDYASIKLTQHPAPLILASCLLVYLVLKGTGRWRSGAAWEAVKATYLQSLATTFGVATMVMMASVMIDTGMTGVLARGIAGASGPLFPLFSPFIGALGAFLTGSNTNSNIMFGALQAETAKALGISAVTVASVQSIGGSLGSAVAPAKVLVGTALTGLGGREAEVMKRALPYCLALVALAGLEGWLVAYLFR